jgi:hypothetical protein
MAFVADAFESIVDAVEAVVDSVIYLVTGNYEGDNRYEMIKLVKKRLFDNNLHLYL